MEEREISMGSGWKMTIREDVDKYGKKFIEIAKVRKDRKIGRFKLNPRYGVALMGLAASWIAGLLQKHRWIAYAGLAVILYVDIEMIYRGSLEVQPYVEAFASG